MEETLQLVPFQEDDDDLDEAETMGPDGAPKKQVTRQAKKDAAEKSKDSELKKKRGIRKSDGPSYFDTETKMKDFADKNVLTLPNIHEMLMMCPLRGQQNTRWEAEWAGVLLLAIVDMYPTVSNALEWNNLFEFTGLSENVSLKTEDTSFMSTPSGNGTKKKTRKLNAEFSGPVSWSAVVRKLDTLLQDDQRKLLNGDKGKGQKSVGQYLRTKMAARGSGVGYKDEYHTLFPDLVCGFLAKLYCAKNGWSISAPSMELAVGRDIWAGYCATKKKFPKFWEQKLVINLPINVKYPHALKDVPSEGVSPAIHKDVEVIIEEGSNDLSALYDITDACDIKDDYTSFVPTRKVFFNLKDDIEDLKNNVSSTDSQLKHLASQYIMTKKSLDGLKNELEKKEAELKRQEVDARNADKLRNVIADVEDAEFESTATESIDFLHQVRASYLKHNTERTSEGYREFLKKAATVLTNMTAGQAADTDFIVETNNKTTSKTVPEHPKPLEQVPISNSQGAVDVLKSQQNKRQRLSDDEDTKSQGIAKKTQIGNMITANGAIKLVEVEKNQVKAAIFDKFGEVNDRMENLDRNSENESEDEFDEESANDDDSDIEMIEMLDDDE